MNSVSRKAAIGANAVRYLLGEQTELAEDVSAT